MAPCLNRRRTPGSRKVLAPREAPQSGTELVIAPKHHAWRSGGEDAESSSSATSQRAIAKPVGHRLDASGVIGRLPGRDRRASMPALGADAFSGQPTAKESSPST
jgi:hypothetical protein